MAAPVVSIVGLRALRRDIARQADTRPSELYDALRVAGRQAAEPIAAATRATVPRVSGDLAGDVRVLASRTGAGVRMGRKSLRYAPWIEFGGNLPQGPRRPYVAAGRYLFPAARQYSYRAAGLYSDALQRVLNSSNIWTNSTTNLGAVHD